MRTIAQETCDRCGPSVRAAVLVRNIPLPNEGEIIRTGELTFCGHHADDYALDFIAAGYTVTDYRHIYKGAAA